MKINDKFFSKIPQSALISGDRFEELVNFVEKWSAKILECNIVCNDVKKHPDYNAIWPTNKMRQINIDTLREFNRIIFVTPQLSTRKVAVIYEADRLNSASSNALLKTLEEPPIDTSIFLITTKPYDLLPTLRSRCWWLHFNFNSENQIYDDLNPWLESLNNIISQRYLSDTGEVNIMQIYSLIYKLNEILIDKNAYNKSDVNPNLSDDEQVAQKSLIEKRNISNIIKKIEDSLSDFVKKADNIILYDQFPSIISLVEKSYKHTELNLNPLSAVENFLLKL